MMEKLTLETAIAYRSFELAGKPNEKVEIFIGRPQKLHETEWFCPYRIVGGGKDLNFQVNAHDSIQTLQLIWKVIDGTLAGAGLVLTENGRPFEGLAQGLLK